VSEPLTAESLAYWHREVTDRHNGDSPWRDEDVMVLVARFLATLEAAARATPTPDTLNAEARALAVVFAWTQQPAPDGTFEAGDQPTSYWRDRAEAVREALADD